MTSIATRSTSRPGTASTPHNLASRYVTLCSATRRVSIQRRYSVAQGHGHQRELLFMARKIFIMYFIVIHDISGNSITTTTTTTTTSTTITTITITVGGVSKWHWPSIYAWLSVPSFPHPLSPLSLSMWHFLPSSPLTPSLPRPSQCSLKCQTERSCRQSLLPPFIILHPLPLLSVDCNVNLTVRIFTIYTWLLISSPTTRFGPKHNIFYASTNYFIRSDVNNE